MMSYSPPSSTTFLLFLFSSTQYKWKKRRRFFCGWDFKEKYQLKNNQTKNKATAINQINYGERAGEALRLAKIRPVVAWWRGRGRVFLNIASENVYKKSKSKHTGFDIHEKTNRTIQDMLVYLQGNKIKL